MSIAINDIANPIPDLIKFLKNQFKVYYTYLIN